MKSESTNAGRSAFDLDDLGFEIIAVGDNPVMKEIINFTKVCLQGWLLGEMISFSPIARVSNADSPRLAPPGQAKPPLRPP